MKRFICYLYEYQEGIRIRNIGFCKVEISEEGSVVSIHGKGWGVNSPEKLELYLFWRENGNCYGVYQGELSNISPALNYRLVYAAEDLGSQERYDRTEGLILCGENGPRYAAVWTDEDVDIRQMKAVEKEYEDHEEKEEKKSTDMPEEPVGVSYDMKEITMRQNEEEVSEILVDSEEETEMLDEEEKSEVTEQECGEKCRFQCTKIQRQDLSRLIRREWQLANNSFLLHGYYNYHHLAFLQEGEILYLGVPGIYSEKERRAAQAFGFPGFVNYEEVALELKEGDKEADPDFGYWCRQVHQIRV